MATSITHLLPASGPQPTQAQRLLTPTTQAIPLLQSQTARIYSYVHTALVLGWVLLRFGALVQDPVEEMIRGLVLVGILQGVACGVCLPGMGNWSAGKSERMGTGGAGKTPVISSASGSVRRRGPGMGKSAAASWTGAGGVSGALRNRVKPALFSLILSITLPPLPLTLLALVLGAPLYPSSHLPHTLLLSLHVSFLAFLPIFYTHGVSSTAWRDVMAAWLPFDEAGVWGGTVGCLVGGWIGAVPMALDWDREWQKWPVTVLVGCYMGWAFGRVITGALGLGVGRRIDFGEDEGPEVQKVVPAGKELEGKKLA